MRAGDAEQVRTLVQMHIENARHKVRLFLKTRQTEQG
jgi:DNA-binding GntR family transcriptional regulator